MYAVIMKKYIFFNQTKQMIDQKNIMDPATTEHSFLKSEVDFELLFLWRGISKIQRTTRMAT